MLLLANIDNNSSLTSLLYAYAVMLLLKQECTFYMIVHIIQSDKSLKDVIIFLKFNPGAFCFQSSIT